MAGDVHNKEGKKCGRCNHIFTKSSLTLTLSKRVQTLKGHDEKETVCGACHHAHYERGE